MDVLLVVSVRVLVLWTCLKSDWERFSNLGTSEEKFTLELVGAVEALLL